MNLNTISLPCLVGKANKESQYLVYLPHSRVQQACMMIKFHFISTCPCTKQASQLKAVNFFGDYIFAKLEPLKNEKEIFG